MRRVALGFAAGACLFAMGPATALATDYCVQDSGCVAGAGTPQPTVEAALAAADASAAADRVLIGPGTFTAPSTSGYHAVNPVQVVGAGAGATVLTGPTNTGNVLYLNNAGSSVSDLAIKIPKNSDNVPKRGLYTSGTARRLSVTADPGLTAVGSGVDLWGGALLEDSAIAMSTPNASGVQADHATVRDTTVSAQWPLQARGADVHFDRDRVTTTDGIGIDVVNSNANIDATDTLVRLVGKAEGVDATTANNTDAAIALRNVTIVGDGSPDSIGVSAGSLNAHTASVTLDSSIVRGVETSLWRSALAGTANLTALYSDYDPATIVDTGAGALAIGPGNINSDPLFAGASDFHLLAGAPAVDAGNPASFSDTVDLDGQPRVTDGNGDGDARRDMGALERAGIAPPATRPTQPLTTRDHTAPRIARLVVAPSRFAAASGSTTRSGRVARGTHFRFWLSEEADVRIEIQRRLPGSHARYRKLGTLRRHVTAGSRSVRFNGRLGGRALRAGRYRAVLTATDAARNRSGAYRVAFRVVRG